MPSSLRFYKNETKKKAYIKRHKDRYYNKNMENCYKQRQPWADYEIRLILFAPLSDTELSIKLHRSIKAIQVQRCRAKKKIEQYIM